MIFWTVRYTNTQIQIHKYTNTQIQHMTKWPKYPTYAIFLNSWWFKDVKNDILDCQIHKYTNTNTQIHKYTNTAYDKMTKIPNICYIFEQLVVQGCQKWQSQVFWSKIHSWLLHGPTRFILIIIIITKNFLQNYRGNEYFFPVIRGKRRFCWPKKKRSLLKFGKKLGKILKIRKNTLEN